MNNLRKYLTPLILVIALFAINGSEFFHHHDASDINVTEDKCEACLFSHTLNTVVVEQVYVFTPQVLLFQTVINSVKPVYLADWFSSSPGRAPPAVSHI